MSKAAALVTSPQVGDQVILRGTRVVGDVTRIDESGSDRQVSVKVTAVIGKAHGSKTAKAWRGTWITCTPTLVTPLTVSPN